MAITPFDLPHPKTPRHTQTSWLYRMAQKKIAQSLIQRHLATVFSRITRLSRTTAQKLTGNTKMGKSLAAGKGTT